MGSNISANHFQNQILEVFTSFRQDVSHQELHRFSRLYKGYFRSETFKDVQKATRRSLQGALFDEMVRLWSSEQLDATRQIHQIFGLRNIVYSNHEELASLLNATEHPLNSDVSSISHIVQPSATKSTNMTMIRSWKLAVRWMKSHQRPST